MADGIAGDEAIDGLANGDAALTQAAIMTGALYGLLRAEHVDNLESGQRLPGGFKIPIITKALKHLGQNQVTDKDFFIAQGVCRDSRSPA